MAASKTKKASGENIPRPKDVALAISEKRCPVPSPVDQVVLGKAMRVAIACGYVRINHGCFDDWGGYSVTELGRAAMGREA